MLFSTVYGRFSSYWHKIGNLPRTVWNVRLQHCDKYRILTTTTYVFFWFLLLETWQFDCMMNRWSWPRTLNEEGECWIWDTGREIMRSYGAWNRSWLGAGTRGWRSIHGKVGVCALTLRWSAWMAEWRERSECINDIIMSNISTCASFHWPYLMPP